jgi:hypothetical protein
MRGQENEKMSTPEQEKQQAAQIRDEITSLEFIADHPEFKACEQNAQKVAAYIKANTNGAWTRSNIEDAFYELKSKGELELIAYTPPTPSAEEPPPVEPPKKPWGELSKASIAAMDSELYKQFYKSAEFRREVNRVLRGEQ